MHGIYQGLVKPVQKAFVTDVAPAHHRAQALGRFSMWAGMFAIPAPLLFGLGWDRLGREVPFLISGIIVLASGIALGLLVPGKLAHAEDAAA
jgi:MFS family permease